MLFASTDPALTGFAIFVILGCWALWFFAIREKPGDKSQ